MPEYDTKISLKCDQELVDRLDDRADDLGVTRSALVRMAAEYAVEADLGVMDPLPGSPPGDWHADD